MRNDDMESPEYKNMDLETKNLSEIFNYLLRLMQEVKTITTGNTCDEKPRIHKFFSSWLKPNFTDVHKIISNEPNDKCPLDSNKDI